MILAGCWMVASANVTPIVQLHVSIPTVRLGGVCLDNPFNTLVPLRCRQCTWLLIFPNENLFTFIAYESILLT